MFQTNLAPTVPDSGTDIRLIEQLCDKIALGERAMNVLDHGSEDEAVRDVLENELREALALLRRMTGELPTGTGFVAGYSGQHAIQ